MTETRSALVIGGGIAGPAMAMALRKAGIEATVYEAYASTAEAVGGGLSIAPNGEAALAVLGIGVYHDAPAVVNVAGWGIPALVEGPDGLYRYTSSTQSRPGARRLVLHLPVSPQRRLVRYATAHARGFVTLSVDGSITGQDQNSAGGSALGGGALLSPGRPHTVTLRLRDSASPRTVLGLIVSTKTG